MENKRIKKSYKEYDKAYHLAHREERIAKTLAWRGAHLEYDRENHKRRNAKYREAMLEAYGKACVCCGETIAAFLSIDHINRNGQAHRKELGAGLNFLVALRKLGWPKEGIQILCMNCNWATKYGHICPHKKEIVISQTAAPLLEKPLDKI